MPENSARLELPLLHAGQAHKELTHNMALLRLDALVHAAVVADDCLSPPAAPSAGQCWIVPQAGAAAWAMPAGSIAAFTGQGWLVIAPQAGMWLWIHSRKKFCWHDGTNWQATGLPCVLSASWHEDSGTAWDAPIAGETIDAAARQKIDEIINFLKSHGLAVKQET